MDDLLELFGEVLEAGDVGDLRLDLAPEFAGIGLELPDLGATPELEKVLGDMNDLPLSSTDGIEATTHVLDTDSFVEPGLDSLALEEPWMALDSADVPPPEETFLGAKLVHGDPAGSVIAFNEQCYNDSCAVACQTQVLQQFTGQPVEERILAEQARQFGWYVPGAGTPLQHTGSLLELHGLQTTNVTGVGLDQIKGWLDQGKAVIVGVDAEEIWNAQTPQCTLNEMLGYPDAGHAVQVIGVEQDLSTGQTTVVLNDPGRSDGAGFKVPAAAFQDAWDDTKRFACVVSRS